jgi:hypothetical protein
VGEEILVPIPRETIQSLTATIAALNAEWATIVQSPLHSREQVARLTDIKAMLHSLEERRRALLAGRNEGGHGF